MRHTLPRGSRVALLVAATTCGLAGAAHASGFVYTAVPAAPCATESPCAPPHVLVVDADTAAVVIRLPLPVHTQPAGMALSPDGAHLYVSNRAAEHSGVTSMTVIDARHHRLIASVHPADGGGRTARRPGRRLPRLHCECAAPQPVRHVDPRHRRIGAARGADACRSLPAPRWTGCSFFNSRPPSAARC